MAADTCTRFWRSAQNVVVTVRLRPRAHHHPPHLPTYYHLVTSLGDPKPVENRLADNTKTYAGYSISSNSTTKRTEKRNLTPGRGRFKSAHDERSTRESATRQKCIYLPCNADVQVPHFVFACTQRMEFWHGTRYVPISISNINTSSLFLSNRLTHSHQWPFDNKRTATSL